MPVWDICICDSAKLMLIVLQYKKSEFLGIHETQLPRLNDAADTAASRASDNVASVIDCDCV